jgi:hypothetical protein
MTPLQELNLFLEQHPHLKPLQERLEREMRLVPDEHRHLVVAKYLMSNLEELAIELQLLRSMLL